MTAVTIMDAYPIPLVYGCKFFYVVGFWLCVLLSAPQKTRQREDRLFQWKRMPFALYNATATFQRLVAQAITNVNKKYDNLIMCYIDEVVIATTTLNDHIRRLDEVFSCMKQAGLKCSPSKSETLRDSIKFLGRLVDKNVFRPDPEAVEVFLTWKSPKTDTQLMSFLGFANCYREFIKGYADKTCPMQRLTLEEGKKKARLTRLMSCLRVLSANFARLRSSACRQKMGCFY